MGCWDYYRGTLRDYHRDPFPHSLLRTKEKIPELTLKVSTSRAEWVFLRGGSGQPPQPSFHTRPCHWGAGGWERQTPDHVCIYVYMYICIYVYMYVYIYIYMHTHLSLSLCLALSLALSLSLSLSLCVYIYIHRNTCNTEYSEWY